MQYLNRRLDCSSCRFHLYQKKVQRYLDLYGVKGRDMVITGGNPVADPANTVRDEVDLLLGVNLLGTGGWEKDHRFAVEVGVAVYEKVDGVQMNHDWMLTLGWQKTF